MWLFSTQSNMPPRFQKARAPPNSGAHDAGIDYGVLAADIAADNMAAHIAAEANAPGAPASMGDEWEDPDVAEQGGKRRRGGAHDKQTMWTGDEDLLLTNVVNDGAYTEKGKIQWKKLTINHFPTRNDASVRNHYLRIQNASVEREREDGDKKRNKCRKCGQIKFGHRCTGSQPEWPIADFEAIANLVRDAFPDNEYEFQVDSDSAGSSGLGAAAAALAAGSGSGGSAAGSSAGGKSFRAAGFKVIASARIVKRFVEFKSVKLHTVLESMAHGDAPEEALKILVHGWVAQSFPHGLAPSDNYPPNGRPRALTRAVTESIDASFEAYVKSLIDDF